LPVRRDDCGHVKYTKRARWAGNLGMIPLSVLPRIEPPQD
jgi:hypothetical protein